MSHEPLRLAGDHYRGAGAAQLGEVAISSHADFELWPFAANDRTVEVGLQ